MKAWGSSLSAEAWSELLGRRQDLETLALPPDFDRVGSLSDNLQFLDLRGSDIDVVDALPQTLRRLDLRNSAVRRIHSLPPHLHWLDLRYSKNLESLPTEILPAGLTHLGVDGRWAAAWLEKSGSGFPQGLRSLAVHQPPEGLLEHGLPPDLKVLELVGGRVKRFQKLPSSLRRVCLFGTRLESLEALPRNLDYLALTSGTEGFLDSKRLPPYLTELHLGEGVQLQVRRGPHGDRQLRFVHTLKTDDAVLVPISDRSGTDRGLKIFPLLTELTTDSFPWLPREQLLGLDHLRADIPENAESRSLWALLESLPETTRLDLKLSGLESLRDRPELEERLTGLTLAQPYEGGSLPSELETLDLQLRETPGPAQWPEHVRHLVIRHRGERPLDELLSSLPGLLEELEIESTGQGVTLPADLELPGTLRVLKLAGLDMTPWIKENRRQPLPLLETLILKDTLVDSLAWLSPGVNRVLVLDGHPEEPEGFDGCL